MALSYSEFSSLLEKLDYIDAQTDGARRTASSLLPLFMREKGIVELEIITNL